MRVCYKHFPKPWITSNTIGLEFSPIRYLVRSRCKTFPEP